MFKVEDTFTIPERGIVAWGIVLEGDFHIKKDVGTSLKVDRTGEVAEILGFQVYCIAGQGKKGTSVGILFKKLDVKVGDTLFR